MLFTRHIRIVHNLFAVPNDVPIDSGMSDPVSPMCEGRLTFEQ
jgi:hypothetical protein